MKKCLRAVLASAIILFLFSPPAMAKILRYALIVPTWSGDYVGATAMADYVKEKTNGALEIKVFPASQLGGSMSMTQQVQGGTLDLCTASTATLQNTVSQVAALDLPFVWPDQETALSVVMDPEFQERLNALMNKKGLAFLGYGQNGWRGLTNSQHPVRKPADMKGMKIRVQQSPIYLDTFKLLGMTPVPMAFGEVYQALQQGVIDAQDNASWVSAMMKFTEVNKHVTELGHVYQFSVVAINVDLWNRLTPEQQKIMKEGAKLSFEVNLKHTEKLKKDIPKSGGLSYEEILKKDKCELVKLTKEERAAFAEVVKPIWEKYSTFIGKDFYDFFMAKRAEHIK